MPATPQQSPAEAGARLTDAHAVLGAVQLLQAQDLIPGPPSPLRGRAAIARAAETPAASVVRQGMPWLTAARRIS